MLFFYRYESASFICEQDFVIQRVINMRNYIIKSLEINYFILLYSLLYSLLPINYRIKIKIKIAFTSESNRQQLTEYYTVITLI